MEPSSVIEGARSARLIRVHDFVDAVAARGGVAAAAVELPLPRSALVLPAMMARKHHADRTNRTQAWHLRGRGFGHDREIIEQQFKFPLAWPARSDQRRAAFWPYSRARAALAARKTQDKSNDFDSQKQSHYYLSARFKYKRSCHSFCVPVAGHGGPVVCRCNSLRQRRA
jgi:hypothetical protein